jgi:predicted small lipoprotein YifL
MRRFPAFAVLALLASVSACAPRASLSPPPAARCAFDVQPERVAEDDAFLHERLDLPDSEVVWSQTQPDSPELRHFRDGVRARTDVEPLGLIRRSIPFHANSKHERIRDEVANMEVVLAGRAGQIAPVNCLESWLLARQSARHPMLEWPTELGAFVLRKQDAGGQRLRVYFSSGNRVGGRISQEVLARIDEDLKQGWVVLAHLHNHPFMFDRKPGDRTWATEETQDDIGGGVSPSTTDVWFYRSNHAHTGLRGAWVTNGFHTLHLTAAELPLLQATK